VGRIWVELQLALISAVPSRRGDWICWSRTHGPIRFADGHCGNRFTVPAASDDVKVRNQLLEMNSNSEIDKVAR